MTGSPKLEDVLAWAIGMSEPDPEPQWQPAVAVKVSTDVPANAGGEAGRVAGARIKFTVRAVLPPDPDDDYAVDPVVRDVEHGRTVAAGPMLELARTAYFARKGTSGARDAVVAEVASIAAEVRTRAMNALADRWAADLPGW